MVSPGFDPRPLLSVQIAIDGFRNDRAVSPGFDPRPLLSGYVRVNRPQGVLVSPGFDPRPLLSEDLDVQVNDFSVRVAGVRPPAFVERL